MQKADVCFKASYIAILYILRYLSTCQQNDLLSVELYSLNPGLLNYIFTSTANWESLELNFAFHYHFLKKYLAIFFLAS